MFILPHPLQLTNSQRFRLFDVITNIVSLLTRRCTVDSNLTALNPVYTAAKAHRNYGITTYCINSMLHEYEFNKICFV